MYLERTVKEVEIGWGTRGENRSDKCEGNPLNPVFFRSFEVVVRLSISWQIPRHVCSGDSALSRLFRGFGTVPIMCIKTLFCIEGERRQFVILGLASVTPGNKVF